MLHSILVPLDGSSFSERTLPLANHVARASGAALHLAHVHVPHEPEHLLGNTSFQYEGVNLSEYDARHRRDERAYLEGLTERMRAEGTVVDSTLLEGEPITDQILRYADDVGTDMIFLTSHGYTGMKRAVRGSIADTLLHKTSVPLLVMHPTLADEDASPRSRFAHLLVPLDGSSLAEHILEPVRDVAEATGAHVTLLRVIVSPTVLGPRLKPIDPAQLEPDAGVVRSYLTEVADALRGGGLEVSVQVAEGTSPAPVIADVADELEADLIAIATHGFGGLKRTLFGSTADQLLHKSRLPLLMMRPPLDA
jgi:nucleotide-binding universal stress UspA family protein